MDTKQAKSEIDYIAWQNDADFREDYSGRGMYGKFCYGIVTNRDNHNAVIADIHNSDLPEPAQDSMGLGTILYWPQFKSDFSYEDMPE